MITATHLYLVLLILGGALGVLGGMKSRRDDASLLTSKPFLRGCLMITSGTIVLVLVIRSVMGNWLAVTIVGILILINEYAMMLLFKSQKSSTKSVVAAEHPTDSEDRLQIRRSGKLRYVLINAGMYALSGGVLTTFAVLLTPKQIPLFMPIAVAVAGAIGGAIAGIRQWNQAKS